MDSVMLGSLVAVVLIFGGSLIGIFVTKTQGFGQYATSVTVLTLALFIAALAVVLGKAEWERLSNLLFAVIGFAGGLVTAKQAEK